MARRPTPLPDAAAIAALADTAGRLAVRVTPGASADALTLPAAGADPVLAVRVTAPALDGRANSAAIKLIAKGLGRPASSIALLRGEGSRHKLVDIG